MHVLAKAAVAVAGGLTVLCAAGCAGGRPAAADRGRVPARGSVQACIAFGVRAIDEHRTVTQVPAACRGLSRAEVNFALGRAIYLVAGKGHRKVVWRHDAAVAGARLARLITALAQPSPGTGPGTSVAAGAVGGRPGPVDRRPLGLAALAAWLLTVASGGYMLGRFVAGGGLRRQRAAGDRTGPAVVLSHFGLASTGLLVWACYVATSWLGLAWAAVGLLLPVIGFGMATLIVWTSGTSRRPFRTSGSPAGTSGTSGAPAGTSGAQARTSPATAPTQVRLAEVTAPAPPGQPAPAPRPSRWLTVVIPIGHGLLAATTILLALLTALGAT
jgi:hypothetical protein